MAEYYYNNPKFVPVALARAKNVFPQIEKQFDRIGIPEELKYVAVLESLLNPNARSKAGAVGLWQLMESTANDFNLKMTYNLDERKNISKSTRAAGKFLKRLYVKYDDWFLALAAYNYGPGNINKILKRNPHATTFWEIQHLLPKETREYVPRFIAISYFMEYASDYNFQPVKGKKKRVRKSQKPKVKRKAIVIASLNTSDKIEVKSEQEEVPYCIRLFPIPVSNSLVGTLEQGDSSPFNDPGVHIETAEIDAILKGTYEEESDNPYDFPNRQNPNNDLDIEAFLGVRKEFTDATGLAVLTS